MDAVEHISRIARILRQPRGSAMLVGRSVGPGLARGLDCSCWLLTAQYDILARSALRFPSLPCAQVGVGGSGKSSLTRFASFIADTRCASVELTRNYGLTEFREDLKKLYK
jgi:dynein heavy chain, axonemal